MKKKRPSRDISGLGVALRQARRIAVVGVGSDLRGDDVAGILVINELRISLARSKRSVIRLFDGGTAPENITGEIIRFKPSHILLVDAAGLGLKPGAVKLLEPAEIGGVIFSTHVLPLKIMADYLKQSLSCRIIVIGIQPGRIDFGAAVSAKIKLAARRLAHEILRAAGGGSQGRSARSLASKS
jgi:hydrogenase 3 maturation protease